MLIVSRSTIRGFLAVALISVIASCSAGTSNKVGTKNSLPSFSSFKIYGNFCGPGYPLIQKATKAAEIAALVGMAYKDSLDRYCKLHDICYAKTFFSNKQCDEKIVFRARALAFAHKKAAQVGSGDTIVENKRCVLLANLIAEYFSGVHPSKRIPVDQIDAEKRISRILNLPFRITALGLNTLNMSIVGNPKIACPRAILVMNLDNKIHQIIANDGLSH